MSVANQNWISQSILPRDSSIDIGNEQYPFRNLNCENIVADTLTVENKIVVNNTDIKDPIVTIAAGNNSDVINTGILHQYTQGTTRYAGLMRYAGNSNFYLIENATILPSISSNISAFSRGDLTVNNCTSLKSYVTDTSNQLILGTGTTTTINATTPASSCVYTIPDVSANANFVMSEGNQDVKGVKSFLNDLYVKNTTGVANLYIQGTNQSGFSIYSTNNASGLEIWSTPLSTTLLRLRNSLTSGRLLLTDGSNYLASSTLAEADLVTTSGNQTINGIKTHSSQIPITATTNQLVLGTTNTTTITAPAPSASRTYTIPDAGGAAQFVMNASNQTIGGTKTFSSGVPISATTNQLVLGTTNTTTITAPAPAASRTYTIPDAGGAAQFVMNASNQTIGGIKTFSSGVPISATTNQLVLGTTNTTTITAPAPTGPRVITIPDVSANADVVLNQGAQTINGDKTFSGTILPNFVVNTNATWIGQSFSQNFTYFRTKSFTAIPANSVATSWTVQCTKGTLLNYCTAMFEIRICTSEQLIGNQYGIYRYFLDVNNGVPSAVLIDSKTSATPATVVINSSGDGTTAIVIFTINVRSTAGGNGMNGAAHIQLTAAPGFNTTNTWSVS